MRIALDFAFRLTGGVIPYLKEMVRLLPEVDPENEYLLLVTDKGYEMVKSYLPKRNIEYKIMPWLKNGIILRCFWEQIVLPFLLYKNDVDVLYSINNRAPFLSIGFKRVVLLGTLGPFIDEFIQHLGFWASVKHRLLAKLIILSLGHADMTIFESYYTKEMIEEKYGYRGRWCVNHHCRPSFKREGYSLEYMNSIRKEFGLERDYFLYTTYVREYKNLERAIEAFASIQEELKKPVDFIVAGPADSQDYLKKLLELCSAYGVENSFRFIGKVEHEKLAPLALGCLGYVFPSKFENSSAALVEALTYGLAIVTSTGTAMPETCGEAAIYFEPQDTKGLADAMLRLANDQDMRETLKDKSLKRAAHFNDMKGDIRFNLGIFREVMINEKQRADTM